MKRREFKIGEVCYWSGNDPQFCVILGPCRNFIDSYRAFLLLDMSSFDISLSGTRLRSATTEELIQLKQKMS